MSDNYGSIEAALDGWQQSAGIEPPAQQPAPDEGQQAEEQAPSEAKPDSESEEPPEEEQPLDADSAEEDDGEPVEEHEEPDEEDAEQPTYTVLVNGKQEEVSLEELTKGYMREADYTRKTQAVAEDRKAVAAAGEHAQTKINEADATLQAIDAMFFGTPPQQPPVELMRTDPAAYEEQKRFFEQWHQSKQMLDGKRQEIQQAQQAEQQQNFQKTAQAELQSFLKAFPDVKDEMTLNAKVGELRHFATGYGYKLEELTQMIDHRAYVVLSELKALKEATAGASDKARMKVKKAKVKSATPGRKQTAPRLSKRDQAHKRFESVTSNPNDPNRSVLSQIDAAVEAWGAKD